METKFNFKSQICTDKNQSERLLALGLKKETADMFYSTILENDDIARVCYEDFWNSNKAIDGYIRRRCIPAWSLDRLREMLNKNGVTISFIERDTSIIVERYGIFQNVCEIWDNVYDNICDAVEWLINEGHFPKEYLV